MTNRLFRNSILNLLVLAAGPTYAFGQTFAATGNTTVSVAVAAESAISISTATTNLAETTGVGIFGSSFTGTTTFLYKVRTSKTGGAGSITVKFTSDFASGGPSITTPPTGDTMTYTCTATASSATACTGPINASSSAATSVATMGVDAHSAAGASASDTGTVVWTLPNDPLYKTGTYTATALFTISAS